MKKAISNIFYMVGLLWKCSPARVVLTFIYTLFQSLLSVIAGVITFPYIVGAVERGESFKHIALVVGILILLQFLMTAFLDWLGSCYGPKSDAVLDRYFNKMVFHKTAKIDLAQYDDPAFYDRFEKAIQDAGTRARAILSDLCGVVSSLFVFSSVITFILAVSDPLLAVFAMLPVLISIPLTLKRNKTGYQYAMSRVSPERRLQYVRRVLFLRDYASDVRSSGLPNLLWRQHDRATEDLIDLVRKYGWKMTGLGIWESGGQWSITLLTYMYLVYRVVVSATIPLGNFFAVFYSVRTAEQHLRMIIDIVPRMHEHSLYAENFRTFLSLPSKIEGQTEGAALPSDIGLLELRSVSFRYSPESPPALDNISLTAAPGSKIAIVGRNGAGKTTLMKLLMRLYEPDDGEILYAGKPCCDYLPAEYRAGFGVVFQDFRLYAVSLAENVLMREPLDSDSAPLAELLQRVGIYDVLSSLPEGLNTEYSKEFSEDGALLSGGQMQKLAIARAFFGGRSILLFDEASSALDPIAEYEINNMVFDLADQRTVFVVSHRLATTRKADHIFFLEEGRIVEQGSHQGLMSLGGRYAKMYALQAEQYGISSEELP